MKSTNHNSGKNTINKFYLLMVLATSIGFAQTEKSTQEIEKTKSDLSSAGTNNNPYFKENQLAGEMAPLNGNITEPIVITKQRTKSNNTNERTTKPNGQDDGNPFPPKNATKKGSPTRAGYDVVVNKKG